MSSVKVENIFLLITFFSVFVTNEVSSYKILVIYPTGSISHQRAQQTVSQGLAEAGHHVTIISPNPFETTNPNITQIDINFTYEYTKMVDFSVPIGPYKLLSYVSWYFPTITDRLLNFPEVKDIFDNVKKEKYDAVIVEALPYFPLYMAKNIFNTTLIGLITLELMPMMHKAMGNVIHPILHPHNFYSAHNNPSLLDRINLIYFEIYRKYWEIFDFDPVNDVMIQKYFPGTTSTTESLKHSIDFMIEGQTPVLGNVRPLVPNTIQIGNLHIKPPKPLPSHLQKYFDESKTGVIYVSFGSNVKSVNLKPEVRRTLMHTLKKLPYDILWKYENDTFPGKPDNVRIEKWLPQSDLLAHKNVKLFITQGGLQSLEETISRGVPVVAIPFFGDQYATAEKVKVLGIGKRLDLDELTVEKLKGNILEVINNPKYKNNVKQLGDRIRDTPIPPVQTAVWWIEYAIRNRGAEHLKYKGAHVSFIEYYLIDIICVHLVALILVIYSVKQLIKRIRVSQIDAKDRKSNNKMKRQ